MFTSSGEIGRRSRNQNFVDSNSSPSNRDFAAAADFFALAAGSGNLVRYRSAPGSFLTALLDTPPDNSSSGDESEALFSAIWNSGHGPNGNGTLDLNHSGGPPDDETRMRFHNLKQECGRFDSGGTAVVGSYANSGGGTNLVRQSSSPAGFFSGGGGFGVIGGDVVGGNYRINRTNSLNLSSMPSIPENSPENDHETSSLFNGFKRIHDGNLKFFHALSQNQNRGGGSSSSDNKADCEKYKFLQFQQEVVPCQIRAKRGCATHPRSIAERMRRTRISEKMKKLQELFPNMDKQTSTADMLDWAVEYIKELQRQVQTLSETKARCVCVSK